MSDHSILGTCPEYPPAALLQLPHQGPIVAKAEITQAFEQLWDVHQEVMTGDRQLTVRGHRVEVMPALGSLVVTKNLTRRGLEQVCSMQASTEFGRSLVIKSANIEYPRSSDFTDYIERHVRLYGTGHATARQRVHSFEPALQKNMPMYFHDEPERPLEFEGLLFLDNLYKDMLYYSSPSQPAAPSRRGWLQKLLNQRPKTGQ